MQTTVIMHADPAWHPSACNICGQVSGANRKYSFKAQPKQRSPASCDTLERPVFAACCFFCANVQNKTHVLLQLGHQAAQCTNGTINWRQLYGDESFRLKQPLYESDLLNMHKAKSVDLQHLEAQARQYAAVLSTSYQPCQIMSVQSIFQS